MYLLKYLPEKIIEVFTAFTLPTKYEKFSQLLVKQHGMTRSGFQLMTETYKGEKISQYITFFAKIGFSLFSLSETIWTIQNYFGQGIRKYFVN